MALSRLQRLEARMDDLERRVDEAADAANDALDLLGVNDEGVEPDEDPAAAIDILEADEYPATPEPKRKGK